MKNIAVFADVQNIYYTTRQAYGRQFNYRKLWQQLNEMGNVVSANAYAISRDDDQQIKFQDALRHIGFDVKLKPYIQRSDGSTKGDWDVGIAIDVMEAAQSEEQPVDIIVLLSGDGDFDMLMAKVREGYGKEAVVFGVPTLTANSLINAVDRFIPINEDILL
ncbi:NYN domain-containing protein [Enterovibrio sp. ZSDZ35]|uniref:NYN domain-containing protein n=1 Tax=Enterovibrio qingdaonensis TaxID=2899818 RepID=A0ABT5QFS7_9GAMM|nr:NYN domain-containing protein [Enterovibrio sp. ZSDZ35]MDD1779833.1 NYN domain-containing protein [Enterovibrio sp. ZSDZ35]